MATIERKDARRRGTSFSRNEVALLVELMRRQASERQHAPDLWDRVYGKLDRMHRSFA